MEKMLKPYDKELMKAAILKHDQIFKEQVHELHRLYQIQKILMSGTCIQTNNQQQPHLHNQKSLATDINPVHGISTNNNVINSINVDTNINRNGMLGPLGCSRRHIEEGEIQLTLGLGPSTCNNKDNNQARIRNQNMAPSTTTSAGGRRRQSPSSSSSTGSSQTKKAATSTVLMKQQNNGTRQRSDELINRQQLTWGFLQGGIIDGDTGDHMSFDQNGSTAATVGGGARIFNNNGSNDSNNQHGGARIVNNNGSNDSNNQHGDEHLRQQPTWLFQALSLKLT